jgi:hypothetical protein
MPQETDWWARQFIELWKELVRSYQKFCDTKELASLDIAETLKEKLNEAYGLSLNLLDYFQLGLALVQRVCTSTKK